jgi:hypothetical protein
MSTVKKSKLISQISIAAQIADGTIQIESIAEFDNVLKLFPDDPELQRVYSDLLLKRKMPEAAAQSYARAAKLFIESGMMVQAIVAKSLQWKISQPSDLNEARYFFSVLKKGSYQQTPVNSFFNTISTPAMLAILYNLVKVRLPAGTIVKKNGEGEKDLFFVVSGALRETIYQPVQSGREMLYKKLNLNLAESDFFGNVYPFDEDKLSQSYIEAITQVELVKISKAHLVKICRKYPDVEQRILSLIESRPDSGQEKTLLTVRKGGRLHLPINVSVQIDKDASGGNPLILDGYSRDISIGGICVVLNELEQFNASFSRSIKNANVQVSLPSEAMALNVSGTIIWSREMQWEDEKTFLLGIKFKNMVPKFKGMMIAFADSICNRI